MPSCMRCLSSHLWARTRASARAQSSSLPLPAPTRVFDVPEQSDSYHARTWPIQATLQRWGPSELRAVAMCAQACAHCRQACQHNTSRAFEWRLGLEPAV